MLAGYLARHAAAAVEPAVSLLRSSREYAAEVFSFVLAHSPSAVDTELRAWYSIHLMLTSTYEVLRKHSGLELSYEVQLSSPRDAEDDQHLRPNTMVVVHQAALLIGAIRGADALDEAIADLRRHAQAGLSTHHYGTAVPGILGFAASGNQVQLCLIPRYGQVRAAQQTYESAAPDACSARRVALFKQFCHLSAVTAHPRCKL